MTWTLIGGGVEIIGLALAAYGLLLTWRGVAEGHPFVPLRRKSQSAGAVSATLSALTGTAYAYVINPNETVDDKLSRVHQVLAAFDQRLTTEANERKESVRQLRSEVRAERVREESSRKAEARADTRLAAGGLSLAAVGAILQLVRAIATA